MGGKNKLRNMADDPLSFAVAHRDNDALALVRNGLKNDRAMLAFQPVVQTASPEKPAFYEGLIRIMDGTGRIIPARDFIDAVETDELGRQIDCKALELGLSVLGKVPTLRLSINMSARSIGYSRWKRILRRGIRKDPTIGERLILEITERSAMVMPDVVQAFMQEQQDMGISFALDDFGAGFTSFRHLRDFYFDIVKIDGSFIRGISNNPDNQVLARALASIAEHFEMFTVAENVETEADAKFLSSTGIDCLQGYYFGVPTVRPHWLPDSEFHRKIA